MGLASGEIGVNTDQVGPLIQFVIDNCDKILALSLQPISFTGRDDGVTDEERARQRYTTSHLARETRSWSKGKIDPYRDWYPLGAGYLFTALADRMRDPEEEFGGLSISCHPDCGSSVLLVANRKNYYGYVKDRGSDGMELYNLESDIGETHNLTGRHPEIVSEMLELIKAFRWPAKLPDTNITIRKKVSK